MKVEREAARRPRAWRPPQALASLRYRDFRLLIIGQALASVGYWALVVALGVQVLELTDSKLAYGVVTACLSLPFLVFALPAGVVADRVNRQALLTVTRVSLVLLMLALSLLTLAGLITVPLLALIAFAAGSVFALDLPARQTLAPELVAPEEVTNAVATNQLVYTGSTIVGPAIGGVLIGWVGPSGAFLLAALGNLVLVIMVRLMRFPTRTPNTNRPSIGHEMAQGLAYVWRHPILQPLLLLSASLAVLGQPFQSFLPALGKEVLHLPVSRLGLLYTAVGAGSITGAVVVGMLGQVRHRGRIVLFAPFCFGLLLIGAGLSRAWPLTLPLLTLAGIAAAVGNTMTTAILVTIAPAELRGRVMSMNVLVYGFSPVGNLFLGAVADATDVAAALGTSGTLLSAVACLSACTRPRLRTL